MRVTGGSARGRHLKSPPSGVRPSSDRLREAVFNVLEAHGADLSRVLDLYAGSGALGIEALSRGAGRCDFVERSAANASLIRENLRLTGLEEQAAVHQTPVERAPERLAGPYSLVLADPPYDDEAAPDVLARVAGALALTAGALLVLEHSGRREPAQRLDALRLAWSRRYGDSAVAIYRTAGEGQENEEGAR